MTEHLFMAVGIIGMAAAIFALGWQSNKIWVDWRDDRALRAAEARHARRKDDPPRPTVLLADPPPPWHFAGESEQGWASESAEYELLTQTAEQPVAGVDTPSDFIEGMTETVNAMISEWVAQGNVDRHTMKEVG